MKAVIRRARFFALLAPCLLLSTTAAFVSPSGTAGDTWVFLGFLIEEKVENCVNSVHTKSGYVWIRDDSDYRRLRDLLGAQLEKNFSKHSFSPIRVSSTRPRVIALVAKNRKCKGGTVPSYAWYSGDDVADLNSRIASDLKTYIPWSVVDWKIEGAVIDGRAEAKKLDAQPQSTVIGQLPK